MAGTTPVRLEKAVFQGRDRSCVFCIASLDIQQRRRKTKTRGEVNGSALACLHSPE